EDVVARGIDRADHFLDDTGRAAVRAAPVRDRDDHDVPRLRIPCAAGGDVDVARQLLVIRHNEAEELRAIRGTCRMEDPYDPFPRPLQDADDRAFDALTAPPPLDACNDLVAVDRRLDRVRRDEDVVPALVRLDEPRAASDAPEPTDDKVDPGRRCIPLPPHAV